jgi:hypothetical protein
VDSANYKVRMIPAVSGNYYGQNGLVAGDIYTITGQGSTGACNNGTAAASASIGASKGITVDSSGDIFIAVYGRNVVCEIDGQANNTTQYGISMTFGKMYLVAGIDGSSGNTGNGAAATSAKLNQPQDVAVDSQNNLYISDNGNNTVRCVANTAAGSGNLCSAGASSAGFIYAFAGSSGSSGNCANGSVANGCLLSGPRGIAIDSSNDLFITDTGNNEVREVFASGGKAYDNISMTAGDIYTVAGQSTGGYAGDSVSCGAVGTGGCAGATTKLSSPYNVAIDSSGDIVIGDDGNARVRFVAGATGSRLGISNMTQYYIYRIAGTGSTTDNGIGLPAIAPAGQSTEANLDNAYGVAVDSTGRYVWDSDNTRDVVREIDTTNDVVWNAAGVATSAGSAGDGSQAAGWGLSDPRQLAIDSNGNIYIADEGADQIKEWLNDGTGEIKTFAGTGGTTTSANGTSRLSVQINGPYGVAVDSSGSVYYAESGADIVREIDGVAGTNTLFGVSQTQGAVYTIAGTLNTACASSPCGPGEGSAGTSVDLSAPKALQLDSSGDVVISDYGDCAVRVLTKNAADSFVNQGMPNAHSVYTVAGTLHSCGTAGGVGDGSVAWTANTVKLDSNWGITIDGSGNLYIAESGGVRIRKVNNSNSLISTYAGSGTTCGHADGNNTSTATFCNPDDVSWDTTTGTLYVADTTNDLIRTVTATTTATLAGTAGSSGQTGNGGRALDGLIYGPEALAISPGGNLYVSEITNTDMRMIYGPDPQ